MRVTLLLPLFPVSFNSLSNIQLLWGKGATPQRVTDIGGREKFNIIDEIMSAAMDDSIGLSLVA
jgi:hypothetical protein